MPITTVAEIFGGAWGIVESRRAEIEAGPFGAFEKIYAQEIGINFWPIDRVATAFDCHPDTARKRMRAGDARFIVVDGAHRFYQADVKKLIDLHKAALLEKVKASATRKAGVA